MGRSRNKDRCFCRIESVYCRLANRYYSCEFYDGDYFCNKTYKEEKNKDIVAVHCKESCFSCELRGNIGVPYTQDGVQYPGKRCHIVETNNKKFLM